MGDGPSRSSSTAAGRRSEERSPAHRRPLPGPGSASVPSLPSLLRYSSPAARSSSCARQPPGSAGSPRSRRSPPRSGSLPPQRRPRASGSRPRTRSSSRWSGSASCSAARRDAKAIAGGLLGLLALAVGLTKLPVLTHGIVLSALPGQLARLAVVVAISAGAAAAILGVVVFFHLLEHYEEPEALRRYL